MDSLLPCQGISHDQSQSFVSPGVTKVKTERRRRLEGNVGFRAYKLFMAEQKCAAPETLPGNLLLVPIISHISKHAGQVLLGNAQQ